MFFFFFYFLFFFFFFWGYGFVWEWRAGSREGGDGWIDVDWIRLKGSGVEWIGGRWLRWVVGLLDC